MVPDSFVLELDNYEASNLLHALEAHPCLNSGDWYMQIRHRLDRCTLTTIPNPLYCQRHAVPAHAADILEDAMRDIDADKGDVSAESWGSLLAVLGILRGQHGLFDPTGALSSTVPDHLPDNDESRGHGSVR